MQNTAFCWFHANSRKRPVDHWSPLALPMLEDAESVQLALGAVLSRVADGRMEPRHAGVLVYGLQIASSNLRNTRFHSSTDDIVTQIDIDIADGELAPVQASQIYFLEGEEPPEEEDDDDDDE